MAKLTVSAAARVEGILMAQSLQAEYIKHRGFAAVETFHKFLLCRYKHINL